MYDYGRDERILESADTPLDDADEWLQSVTGWPLRVLVASVLCPIVLVFANQAQFIFHWDLIFSSDSAAAGWMAMIPVLGIALLAASRFIAAREVRSIVCALSGLVGVGILALCTHWAVGAFLVAAVLVAAGNRVGKQFTLEKAPRVAAAIGGGSMLILCVLPWQGQMMLAELFSARSWANAGWMVCFAILMVLGYAGAGVCLVIPQVPRETASRIVSVLARVLLVWGPFCIVFGRVQLGSVMPFHGGFDLAVLTVAIKLFGGSYPLLVSAGTGVAAWGATWLWKKLDSTPVGSPPQFEQPTEPEPVEPTPVFR